MKNKAQSDPMRLIVFLSLIVVMMSIISSVFRISTLEKTKQEGGSWITNILSISDDIPLINLFTDFIITSYSFIYVHPYLALILGAFFGVPLTYAVIRLIRGGG